MTWALGRSGAWQAQLLSPAPKRWGELLKPIQLSISLTELMIQTINPKKILS
jgi:hypothetical protein